MSYLWFLEVKTKYNHGYILWSNKGGGEDGSGNVVLAENGTIIFRKNKKLLLEYLSALKITETSIRDGGFYDYSVSPARMIGLLKGRRAKYILDLLNLVSDIALSIDSHEIDFIQSPCSVVGKVMDEVTIYNKVRNIQLLSSEELQNEIFNILEWVEKKMIA
ncbi:hypothetical protein [Acinetobacter sp.]|uniref:hypothetical protein n=1 Tax=Acinetobacter sp. TaxID=472 RepID=UPI0035B0FE5F